MSVNDHRIQRRLQMANLVFTVTHAKAHDASGAAAVLLCTQTKHTYNFAQQTDTAPDEEGGGGECCTAKVAKGSFHTCGFASLSHSCLCASASRSRTEERPWGLHTEARACPRPRPPTEHLIISAISPTALGFHGPLTHCGSRQRCRQICQRNVGKHQVQAHAKWPRTALGGGGGRGRRRGGGAAKVGSALSECDMSEVRSGQRKFGDCEVAKWEGQSGDLPLTLARTPLRSYCPPGRGQIKSCARTPSDRQQSPPSPPSRPNPDPH